MLETRRTYSKMEGAAHGSGMMHIETDHRINTVEAISDLDENSSNE